MLSIDQDPDSRSRRPQVAEAWSPRHGAVAGCRVTESRLEMAPALRLRRRGGGSRVIESRLEVAPALR